MICHDWGCVLVWIQAHDGLAAWVQGVGTVVAILFSVLISQDTARRQRREVADRRDEFIAMVESLGCSAGDDLFEERWSCFWSGQEAQDRYLTGAKAPLDRLAETPLVAWPGPRLYQLTVEFIRNANGLIQTFDWVAGQSDAQFENPRKKPAKKRPSTAGPAAHGISAKVVIMASQMEAARALDNLLDECRSLRGHKRDRQYAAGKYRGLMETAWADVIEGMSSAPKEPGASEFGAGVEQLPTASRRQRRTDQTRPNSGGKSD